MAIPSHARRPGPRYRVRLAVPRRGGLRAWGPVSGRFERRLAEQESAAVADARIESETRRGRDYVRVTIAITVTAPDLAQALAAAWWVFRKAASDDTAGWDLAAATAEIHPETGLAGRLRLRVMRAGRRAGRGPRTSRPAEAHLTQAAAASRTGTDLCAPSADA